MTNAEAARWRKEYHEPMHCVVSPDGLLYAHTPISSRADFILAAIEAQATYATRLAEAEGKLNWAEQRIKTKDEWIVYSADQVLTLQTRLAGLEAALKQIVNSSTQSESGRILLKHINDIARAALTESRELLPRSQFTQWKRIIIEWLGGAYDSGGRFSGSGNPDYRDEEDVDDLISRLAKSGEEGVS